MSGPPLHDLKFFRQAFPEIRLPDSWEISTSKSDDVVWNVVLAYLNSFLLSDENELSHRMQCLTGYQEVNANIKHSIEICNPFLHRDASFCDKEISELVAKFKERVEGYVNNGENQFPATAKNFRDFEVSSKLLSCNIVLISLEDKIATIFPAFLYTKHILILYKSNSKRSNGEIQDQFSFCISKEMGIEKRRHALTEILKWVEMIDNKDKMMQKVGKLPDITEDFLISLFKNGFPQFIPVIYETPYILSKLEYAGFQTDPRTKDSDGKSAFFHALKTGESHIISVLYDHAANARLQTDASVRSPDSVIVENLGDLKDHLQLLEKDLNSEEISEKSRCLFRDICRFNDFQIEMCKNIYNLIFEISDEREKIYEGILVILKIYKMYFHYIDVNSSIDENMISLFNEFLEHKYYFSKLDFNSAVMLFDNLFLLKEKLELPNNAYLDIESNFCLFVFLKKFMERYKEKKHLYYASRWIIFQERLSLQKVMGNFKEILENTELSKDNMVDILPEAAVRTLTNSPQIYGEFLVSRLQHYLNSATTTRLNAESGHAEKNLQSILVIERCLQVLGECCKKSDFNSVQRILTLALSKEFIKHLKYIRDCLSHIESHELLNRIKIESDVELFMEIKNDLVKLIKIMVPIYSAHKYKLEKFLLLHSAKSLSKARRKVLEIHENQLKVILPAPEMEESKLSVPTHSCLKPRECYFDDMNSSLEKEINDLNCSGDILHKNTVGGYKYIVQNMIFAIREVLKSLNDHVSEKAIKELDNNFWSLEQILAYITTDRKLTKHSTMLTLMLKQRKTLFTKLKENARQFQKTNKSNNSSTDETPVAQYAIDRMQFSTEPEDTCDNNQESVNQNLAFVNFGELFIKEPISSTFSNSTVVTKEREEADNLSENAKMKLSMHSTMQKSMSKHRKALVAKRKKKPYQFQKTNKLTNSSTEETPVAKYAIDRMQFSTEPKDTRDNNQESVNQNLPFVSFGDLSIMEPTSSTFSNSTVVTKDREEANNLSENAKVKLSMNSTMQKSMSNHRNALVAKRKKKLYQFQMTNKSTNSSTEETPVEQCAIDRIQFSTEPEDTRDNNQEAVNQNLPFVNFGDLSIMKPTSSTSSNSTGVTKEREEAEDFSENAEMKLSMHSTTQKSMSKHRKILVGKRRRKAYQFQKINIPTNSITGTTVAERDRIIKHLSSEPQDNSELIVNSISPFLENAVHFEINNKWRNELEHNGYSREKATSSKTNQVDIAISRKISESENQLKNLSLETIDTKECKKVADLLESADDPETITLTGKNDLSFGESSTFRDDSLRAKVYYNGLVDVDAEDPTEVNDVKRIYSIEDAATLLEKYERISHLVFQEFPDDSNENFHFENIANYSLILKRKTFLGKKEKEFIFRSVPEKLRNIDEVKQKIRDIINCGEVKFTEELYNLLYILKLKDREIKHIKEEIENYGVIDDTIHIVDSARDYFLYLREVIESGKINESDYELLCKNLELSDDAKNILSILLPRQNGNKLEFFRNRINKLKNILIEENNVIRNLWESATPGSKLHVKKTIIQRYLKDFEIQASVETLLFHCMSVSRNSSLKNLWKKTTNLFSGINLRNVLAHGHPLMESLGTLLDPYDLPSEIVGKILQLISDEYIIDCMQQILKQSGTGLKGFLEIMQDEENKQFKTLCEEIQECDRWKAYAILIPVNSGRNA